MNKFAVATDYEAQTAKRDRLTVWSGFAASTFEASGYANNGAKTYSLTDFSGERVSVKLPDGVTAPRTDENYVQIDKAISDALVEHFKA